MAFSAILTGTGRTCTLTSGQSTITASSTTGLVVGATIQGTGIPTGTRIGKIVGTTVTLVDASGVEVTATATGTQSLIFSSVYGSVLTISQSASGDLHTPQDIYNAGFGVMSDNTAKKEIFFPGGLLVTWANIVAGAVFDFGNWTLEFGVNGYWRFQESSILGELRGGYLVNGTQFIKTAGPTFYSNNWNNNGAGGSSMFQNVSGTTATGTFRMHNARFVQISGSNAAFIFTSARMNMIVENMILDYQTDSAGANAGIGAAFGTLKNTYLIKTNAGIGQTNGTNYATFDGLFYVGNYQSVPEHKFNLPNGYTLDSYTPQVTSTQFLGGFNSATSEIYSNINLSSAGWGLNDLKTKYQRYGGPITIQFPRKVSLQFNDGTGADLTNVTLFIKSGATTLINAVQAGDFSQNVQALNLVWDANVASYRVANSFVDTISQTAQFRKNGYISQNVSYSLNTDAFNQPIFLLTDPAYGSVTPTQAAALTGITLDFTNKLISGSNAKTLDELYAFGQYSLALTTNSTQADFQVSNGGIYNLLNTWKLYWTAGALTMGTYNKTFNSSTQWKFGNTASLTLDKDDVTWTPAVRGDVFQFESGSTFNITNGSTLTFSPTAALGYGTGTTSEFRSGSTLNMSDSTLIVNAPTSGSGTYFSNTEAGAIWNISNSIWTFNAPAGGTQPQLAIHAYFLPESIINGLTINGTSTNVVWQMGYITHNSKMVGFKFGGSIFGNGTSNILMDTYTYTGVATTIPNTFGSSNKWWWVDPVMQAGGLFRWNAGSTPTGNSGFYGVIGFRPVIKTEKNGYAPKMRIKADNLSSKYPTKIISVNQESQVSLSEFFRDPTFMASTDGFLPFIDSLDNKTVLNTINWTLDFRQNGWLGQSIEFKAVNAKKGLVAYTASGAVDSNYINDTTGTTDKTLISVNEVTKVISAVTGTLNWSAQRMYNALINKWSSFEIEQNIVTASSGGSLDLSDFTVDDSINFIRGNVSDLLSQVKTTGIIESQANEIPVADVNGSRCSITGLDPQNFGVTWYLRIKKTTGTTWSNYSGTGNNTQIVIDQSEYNVQVRVPGYDWKSVILDATLSLSLDLNLSYHVSANNTPQYTMSYNESLEALINFDYNANSVSITNTTGAIINPGFAEFYRATQRIQHIPALVWIWESPVTANSTSQKILIPAGNAISFFLTENSNASVKATCPVIHQASGQSADDRVRGNSSGYSIILGSPATAESAGLQSAIVSDLLEKLGGSGYSVGTDSLKKIKDQLNEVKTKVDTLENTDLSEVALEATSQSIKTTVEAIATSNSNELLPTVYAIQTQQNNIASDQSDILLAIQSANNNFDPVTDSLSAISDTIDVLKSLVENKTGYSLTTEQVEAIAVAVEAHLLDEGDSKQLINAIVTAIGNSNINETALVAAIRADLERAGGKIDTIPTNPVLANDSRLNHLDADVSSRSTLTVQDIPEGLTVAEIEASTILAKENTSQAIKTKVDTLENTDTSTLSKKADTDLLLKSADYVAPDNAKIVQIKNKVDTLENANLTDTNQLIVDLGTPLQAEDYVAPDNAKIESIDAKVGTLENTDISALPTATEIKEELRPLLTVINDGVKNASKIKTHKTNLPE